MMAITIISHFYPDIDAVFGTWLLRRFGSCKYSGIDQADILLIPAGLIPEEIVHLAFERGNRLIAVDTGRRDFDTHGQQTSEKSASLMIAREFGLEDHPGLSPLIQFVERNEDTGESLAVGDYLAQNLLWPSLIKGIHLYKDWTKPDIFKDMFPLLEAAASFEEFSPDEVCAFWQVKPDEEFNSRLMALVQKWFDNEIQHAGSPFSKYHFSELLGLDKNYTKPACPLFREFLKNSRLSDFLYENDKYPHIYLKNSLIGVLISYALQDDLPMEIMEDQLAPVLKGLMLSEIEWLNVSRQIEEGHCLSLYPFRSKEKNNKYSIVYVEHSSPLVTKAIRHKCRKVGIIICNNPSTQSVSIILNRPSPVQYLKLNRLAALLRRGEAFVRKQKWNLNNQQSHSAGHLMRWYLHDTEKMLMNGSFKSPASEPTAMAPLQLINLLAVFLSDNVPISSTLGCPGEDCRKKACIFNDLRLPICEQIQSMSINPFARALIPEKIKEAHALGVY